MIKPWSRVEAVARLADQVRAGMRIGEVGAVDASVACCGSLVTERGEEWQEGLFLLGASAFADFVTVDLVTYSDAWLPCDLKGRPQPEVYSANGPRLSAALNELAEVLGLETDPDDPTYFAKPTETGAENFLGPDGNASDVWRSFEVPSRYDVFTHAPGFGRIGYRRTAEGDVSFVPVENEHGLIGCLWASDEESAASFEPQDVGDDLVHRAGLVWLARLHSAHERGLTPSAALDELSRLPDEEGAGHVVTSDRPRTADLRVLRESVSND